MKENVVYFSDMPVGTRFRWVSSQYIFIKTGEADLNLKMSEMPFAETNCINLANGHHLVCGPWLRCTPLEYSVDLDDTKETYDENIMNAAASRARTTMTAGYGGPFGAAIVKDGELICVASNTVLLDSDPTCHAEMNAIRMASNILKTHDLSGCTLYATGYPCPMCLGAIIWANIKEAYVSGLPEDAAEIGFRDKFIYDYIARTQNDESVLKINYLPRSIAQKLYSEYSENRRKMY